LRSPRNEVGAHLDLGQLTWDVPLAVVRGYCSESFAYELGEAVANAVKPVMIYQLGDHDPSGLDAWRDLQKKVAGFAPNAEVAFERLAVTPWQIEEFELPTRPTKRSDSRATGFRGGSVEVDAIPAGVLRSPVENAITKHFDPQQLNITRAVEAVEREGLKDLFGQWPGTDMETATMWPSGCWNSSPASPAVTSDDVGQAERHVH
jgi:hypothetical protein